MPEAGPEPGLAALIAASPWAAARVDPVAGDASARRYWRLTADRGPGAIAMDNGAPWGSGMRPFIALSDHLAALGLTVPRLLALSPDGRFALVTDLGPTTLAAHLLTEPEAEAALYEGVVDLLLHLQSAPPPPGLGALDPETGAAMLAPFLDTCDAPRATQIRDGLRAALAGIDGPLVLSLRDFHAENLIHRPGHEGHDRFGLLDFQDAVLAPAAYDLASLLWDARRDVAPATRRAAIARFARGSGRAVAEVETALAILSAQRNLRILGIFDRLVRVEGKTRYAAFAPRVRGHVLEATAHPALASIREPVAALVGDGPA